MENPSGIKKLWAPWRLEYLKTKKKFSKKNSCPFCEFPKEGVSEETLILHQNSQYFIILNKYPYAAGHLMIVPRKHLADPAKVSAKTWANMAEAQRKCMKILAQAFNPQGFNMGLNVGSAAGAGIAQHLHWHVIPRWFGDLNFMPLIGETKVLPVHNRTVYRTLAPLFKKYF